MTARRVIVNDRMQQGYVYYLTAPMGRNFDAGFEPQLTPAQMLALGVFGGKYMTDCVDEFPASWFRKAKLSPLRYDARLNFFGVRASQPLSVWRAKGWIRDEDPRGWFQWYCRYYMGRRSEDDVHGRSLAGAPYAGTSPSCSAPACVATSVVARVSGRRSCTGPTTRGCCRSA
jgi:hypothetical protein